MTTSSQPKGKKQLWSIFKWIVGVFIILLSLGFFSDSFLSGLFLIIAGLLIIPAISKKLKVKFPIWEKEPIRIIVPIALFFISMSIVSNSPAAKEQQEGQKIEAEEAQTEKDEQQARLNEEQATLKAKADSLNLLEEAEKRKKLIIPYTIEKEANIANRPSYYVLINKVNLNDTALMEKMKLLIDEIVETKGTTLDVSIFDHKETLEKTYVDEVKQESSIDISAIKALIKLQETHIIAMFWGEHKNMPYKNGLSMFPSTTGKLSKTIEYNPTTRNSSAAQRQARRN